MCVTKQTARLLDFLDEINYDLSKLKYFIAEASLGAKVTELRTFDRLQTS